MQHSSEYPNRIPFADSVAAKRLDLLVLLLLVLLTLLLGSPMLGTMPCCVCDRASVWERCLKHSNYGVLHITGGVVDCSLNDRI